MIIETLGVLSSRISNLSKYGVSLKEISMDLIKIIQAIATPKSITPKMKLKMSEIISKIISQLLVLLPVKLALFRF